MSALSSYWRLTPARRRMVREAYAHVVSSVFKVRWNAAKAVGRGIAQPAGAPSPDMGELAWAVRAAASRIPTARCLAQALALQAMAGRRGFEARLHIGARTGAAGFEAHAWITSGDRVVLGGRDDLESFRAFPLADLHGWPPHRDARATGRPF
ncbi:MAG: lasso peptide biosynthesis B2 protein [Thermoplasmatota archaeon]